MKSGLLVVLCLCVAAMVSAGADAPDEHTARSMETAHSEQVALATESVCTALAHCSDGSTRYCEGSIDCTTRDSSCPTEAGYVECDGVRTPCPPCEVCELHGEECYGAIDCEIPPGSGCDYCHCKMLDYTTHEGVCLCTW